MIRCDSNERFLATNLLTDRAPDRPDLLIPVLVNGDDEQFKTVFPLLKELRPVPIGLLEAELRGPASDDPTDPQKASSTEFMGEFWLGKIAECVI